MRAARAQSPSPDEETVTPIPDAHCVSGGLRSRRRLWRPRHGLVTLAAVAVLCGVTPSATADPKKDWKVTFVARSCPTYADVMANRERDVNQESLQSLGKDT